MAVETTPLGQKKPDGASELVRLGAKIIADNAQNVQDLIAADRARLDDIEAVVGTPTLVEDPAHPGYYLIA